MWIDGYDIPASFGSAFADIARSGRISDADTGAFDVDVVVNPDAPTTSSTSNRREHTILTGLHHSLVREEFRRVGRRPRSVDPVLVIFGGTDVAGLTGRTCERLRRAGFEVRAVVAPGADLPDGVERLTSPIPVADVMSRSSVLVGAAGHLVVEAACVGLPAVIVCVAENQRRLARTLVESAVATEVAIDDWLDHVTDAVDRSRAPDDHRRRSKELRAIVDGLGAARVFDALRGPSS